MLQKLLDIHSEKNTVLAVGTIVFWVGACSCTSVKFVRFILSNEYHIRYKWTLLLVAVNVTWNLAKVYVYLVLSAVYIVRTVVEIITGRWCGSTTATRAAVNTQQICDPIPWHVLFNITL
jgi:hypothetical protein